MSDFGLNLNPLFPGWIIFIIVLIVFGFFSWLEFRRKQSLLTYRIVALVFILISVLGVLLQPSYKVPALSQTILLTPNFEKARVDSLLRVNSLLKILRTESAETFPGSEVLSSYDDLNSENVKYIFGEGLPAYALETLNNSSFHFFPSEPPEGIVEINVPKTFSSRKSKISGTFNSQRRTKLKLVGPVGVEDSTFVNPGKNSFVLSFRAKQSGLFVYHLISEDSLRNKSTERLPLDVRPEINLRILSLHHFPSAEVRYLKNFLGEKGHSIAFRAQTSKNNFNQEFLNTAKIQLNQLTPELLNSFDLLMIDSKTVEGLIPYERSILEKSVSGGLGLIVFRNSSSKNTEFYLPKGKTLSYDTAHFWVSDKKYVLSSLPLEIRKEPAIKLILQNKNRILSGYRFVGAGKIGFQILQETYRLALEGNNEDYALIWSSLVEKVARRQNQKFELKMSTQFPYYMDEQIDYTVVSSGEKPRASSDHMSVPLAGDVVVDDFWHGKIWAGKSGWHQLQAADSITLNYFIHEPSEWKPLRTNNLIKQTRLAQSKAVETRLQAGTRQNRISSLFFYLIFVLASGFLWLAPKI